MLSALVYPGAGQFLQKRWGVGTFFSILFTIFSLILIFVVFKPIFHNVTAAMNWAADQAANQAFEGISLPRVIGSFIAMIVVYIANIMDIQRTNRKRMPPPPLPPPV